MLKIQDSIPSTFSLYLALHLQHIIKIKNFFLVSLIWILLKIKRKQHLTKSRMLSFKHFTNIYTNIYSHDNIITRDYQEYWNKNNTRLHQEYWNKNNTWLHQEYWNKNNTQLHQEYWNKNNARLHQEYWNKNNTRLHQEYWNKNNTRLHQEYWNKSNARLHQEYWNKNNTRQNTVF